ncbi:hypothetical protein PIB30_105059 [Stylosanthes scabra]|uniref:Uncharacterized protein n=1 Tax=Stylosanthes scabra TaxID=79078 RepID=A0ABU6X132_9FABA|nr:hypothetical protein [Stylosanthes scabra]
MHYVHTTHMHLSPLTRVIKLSSSHLIPPHHPSFISSFPSLLLTRVTLHLQPNVTQQTKLPSPTYFIPTRVTKAMHKLIPTRLQPSSFLVFLELSIRDSHATSLYTHKHTLHTHLMHLSHPSSMASSSDTSRKRRGQAVVIDKETFDAHRFKSPFHEHFFNSNVALKPIIPDT